MKKYVNKKLSKRLMIGGGLLIALSIALALISLFSVYGKAGESLNAGSGLSLETDQLLANIALLTRTAGIIVLAIGVVFY
ncbi:hypothetical protein KBC99_02790 [Candidatus Saccharibacteria bacterium]|nr:hypothetical protein [Candidatus Saccharibacteria bacterium]